MSADDAREIAARFGIDEQPVRSFLSYLAVHLAADGDADTDALVRRFAEASRELEGRMYDPVSAYTGFRDGLRQASVHEAYTLIREAAGDEDPRKLAYRLNGRRAR